MEAVVAKFKVLSLHLPVGTDGIHDKPVSTPGLRAEISTRHLPNMKKCVTGFEQLIFAWLVKKSRVF
jgi:hypothetical protein